MTRADSRFARTRRANPLRVSTTRIERAPPAGVENLRLPSFVRAVVNVSVPRQRCAEPHRTATAATRSLVTSTCRDTTVIVAVPKPATATGRAWSTVVGFRAGRMRSTPSSRCRRSGEQRTCETPVAIAARRVCRQKPHRRVVRARCRTRDRGRQTAAGPQRGRLPAQRALIAHVVPSPETAGRGPHTDAHARAIALRCVRRCVARSRRRPAAATSRRRAGRKLSQFAPPVTAQCPPPIAVTPLLARSPSARAIAPQHLTPPARVIAHAFRRPSAIDVTPLASPDTGTGVELSAGCPSPSSSCPL